MSVVKVTKPPGPFEVIDRASVDAIKDTTALAVWVFLRCKPEGWVVRESHVRDQFNIGRDKYRAALRYLIGLGAVEDRRVQGDQGRIIGRELVIHYAVTPTDGDSVNRAPENPSHGISNDKGSDRKPENPAHGADRAPEKPVRRRKPTDGKSAPLENSDFLESTHPVENTKAREARKSFVLPHSIAADVWGDFEAHRKEIGKPLTDLGRKTNAKVLTGLSREDQRRCVDASIANRWTGLFPPKDNRNDRESAFDRRSRINAELIEAGRRAFESEMG